ncbi:MAG: hypothetical protein AVDCRST_MAG34-1665 [uncultured Nocardioidaceae bacterium]|uniref:Sulfotransferase domain-containing protein n=1 Tax=uncultured Nocardioidaceae bacterium TaxID=253824 RepID=A0A6J4M5G1_9ACTN|nr:MAG: hypothetical protein AVDCRST_MAG34-1665 [uncultured Nocardioidaceae bacterium]
MVGIGDTRVLVIGGWGRCGSTLLDMMLGQIEGFVSAGEVREVWLRGCVENRPCGCGDPFRDCVFWSRVGDEAFGGWDRLDIEAILGVRYRRDRAWGIPRLLLARSRPLDGELRRYVDALERLMKAIATVSGASVVVDSSKLPMHTLLLARADGLDVRLLHLVRDSRGVAFSNTKHVLKTVTAGRPTALPRNGSVGSSARYTVYNGLNDVIARSRMIPAMRLRYEDLIDDPRGKLLEVARHASGDDHHDVTFLRGDEAVLAENHLVDGNPVRFTQGPLRLRVDDEWRRRLPTRQRHTISALTYPFLRRYGYPVR